MKLHFGHKVFGQICILELGSKFNPKTTYINSSDNIRRKEIKAIRFIFLHECTLNAFKFLSVNYGRNGLIKSAQDLGRLSRGQRLRHHLVREVRLRQEADPGQPARGVHLLVYRLDQSPFLGPSVNPGTDVMLLQIFSTKNGELFLHFLLETKLNCAKN
jgi:hypothetical protein